MHDEKGRFLQEHGESNYPEWRSWTHMMQRCYSKTTHAYADYGGRGITVCLEWHEYPNFLRDMGRRPSLDYSLDRIDVNKGYEPGNVRWATKKEQNRNQRSNHMITAFGETYCIGEWAEMKNMHRETLWDRIVRFGWDPERALTQPLKNHPRRRVYTNE